MRTKLPLLVVLGITLVSLNSLHGQSFLTNGLVAYYPFNGNAKDESGNGNDATVVVATLTTDRDGITNSAYFFNGQTDYIDTTDSLGIRSISNRFTVSFWVYPLTRTNEFGSYYIVSKDIWAISQWAVYSLRDGTIKLGTSESQYRPTSVFDSNRWTHFVFTGDRTNVSCYRNGRLVDSATTNLALPPVVGAKLRFGGARYYTGEPVSQFRGAIDDIRIYNRPLSTIEVASLFYSESKKYVQLVKMYTLDFDGLSIGNMYQLQVSTNVFSWTNWGSPFTATSVRYTNAIPIQRVDDWGKIFFRLVPQ